MINLQNLQANDDILIYVNTLDADIPYTSNLFLFGFKNGFTNRWTYVMPEILVQNTRYTKFRITLVHPDDQDPENALVSMSPDGNWDYKLWAIDEPTLSPDFGYVLDEGQMYLDGTSNEVNTVTYYSDNEAEENVVYLTNDYVQCTKWNTAPDLWQFAVQKWDECS